MRKLKVKSPAGEIQTVSFPGGVVYGRRRTMGHISLASIRRVLLVRGYQLVGTRQK